MPQPIRNVGNKSPREVSVEWVRRALAEELRDGSPLVATRAENLVAIAEHYRVQTDVLIEWIHTGAPGKQWSAAEFRRWCEMFATEQR